MTILYLLQFPLCILRVYFYQYLYTPPYKYHRTCTTERPRLCVFTIYIYIHQYITTLCIIYIIFITRRPLVYYIYERLTCGNNPIRRYGRRAFASVPHFHLSTTTSPPQNIPYVTVVEFIIIYDVLPSILLLRHSTYGLYWLHSSIVVRTNSNHKGFEVS